ncbi:MAG: winged helix-turn-helix domain-containing protein [Muribaculaceae bacterium]|nr:winged helix-turn-helix domain-containing protein [Muribaculaceae bacterium]
MVPEFEYFILPTLQTLADRKTHSLDEIRSAVIKKFDFSEKDLLETTRSGNNTKVNDRTTWALTYLRQAGLVDSPKRAHAVISSSGIDLLNNAPTIITRDFLLKHYPLFRDFQNRTRKKKIVSNSTKTHNQPYKSHVPISNLSRIQDLQNLRAGIDSFRKVGADPTAEQVQKLLEMEATIITDQIINEIAPIFNQDFSEIAKRFVVQILYENGKISVKVDTSEETFLKISLDENFISAKLEKDIPKIQKKRRPNLNFFEMGLINGDILSYKEDPNITVAVVSENKVEYNGKEYSLTRLTQELKNLPHAIQPTGEWLFDGENLLDLYNETYTL